jgi:hypothetical protein
MKPILPYKLNERVEVTSAYGPRVLNNKAENHYGLDLVGLKDKSIVAPIDGIVVASKIVTDKSNKTWEWGNYVCIQGVDNNLYYMCHLASRAVKLGQTVSQGTVIGVEGNTGYSFGNHCHFEVRNGLKQLNPAEVLGIENKVGVIHTVTLEQKPEETIVVPAGNIPNSWAVDAVKWAQDNGILKGTDTGELKLHDTATREDMLVFLYRAISLIKGE